MRQLVIFTTPEDAHVGLRHDTAGDFLATPGTADGRPAHIITFPDALPIPDGHGAQLIVTREGFVRVEQRGILYLTRPGPRAEFVVDDIYLSKSF